MSRLTFLRILPLAAFMLTGVQVQPAAAFQAVSIGDFNSAVDIRRAPGRPNLLFIVEQAGRVMLMRNENKLSIPFLDIRDIVQSGGEEGLLSLAFAPDYQTSRRFYVWLVNNNGNLELDEFKVSATNPRRALKSSRRVVLRIQHPDAGNHNGGQLQFGADGYLYISVGDGGGTPTAGQPARDLGSLLGKILRINPIPGGGKEYQIPPDNPYVSKTGRDEIYAYGLRNPWRMAINGNLISIGDVGQGDEEEINILSIANAKGVNFGWPQWEGKLLHDNDSPGQDPPTFPIYTRGHGTGFCAIVGGFIANDPELPTLQGRYIYGDNCTGEIRSFLPNVSAQTVSGEGATGIVKPGLTTFGRGVGGQIYFADGGQVYRLEP